MANPYTQHFRGSAIKGVTTGGQALFSRYRGMPDYRGETYPIGGGDVGPYTPANPTPIQPRTPLTRVAPTTPFTGGRNTSMLTTGPTASAGGTITMNGLTRAYAPTPARDPSMNIGGVMQRPGMAPVTVPQSPSITPNPVSANVQQTERANPLTGAINPQPQGTTAPIGSPARTLGYNQRGNTIPEGDDAESIGTSIFDRSFRDRRQAPGPYAGMVRSLFGPSSLSVI